MQLDRKQLILVVLLTLTWGFNWPMMKMGVTGFPPLAFRAISLWIGVPVLWLALRVLKVNFFVASKDYRPLFWLALTNMFVWHVLIILAISQLSGGRAAILGYTMPVFSALLGVAFFGAQMRSAQWLGVGAASVGVILLLSNELTSFAGKPLGVLMALVAAAVWALGTQKLRHTMIVASTLTLSFWMTLMTAVVLTLMSAIFERHLWAMPPFKTWVAIVYNGILIFGFAHAAWFTLARSLPPVASTLSTMMIPILGVFSGALWLGEVLHWQDWSAVVLMAVAISTVLIPSRQPAKA